MVRSVFVVLFIVLTTWMTRGEETSRVAEIAAMLPDVPTAPGASITDRAAWEAFAKNAGASLISEADRLLQEKTPDLTDDLFLTFSRTGTRSEYEKPYRQRLARLSVFTQAECATDRGKYLPAIAQELSAILSEKTWVMPATDRKLKNFHGEIHDVDLGVAMRSATVATVLSWLGDKLPGDLRAAALQELNLRTFQPYLERLRNDSSPLCYWITVTHNWNAVCHAGIVIAALAVLPDKMLRAEILAGAEKHLAKYYSGFTPDGFCSEGMVYWNYGFGHYVLLAETVLRATGGRIDLYAPGIVRKVAAFPENLALSPGIYPAFSDSPLYPTPEPWISAICHARLFSGSPDGGAGTIAATTFGQMLLYQTAISAFPLAPCQRAGGELALDPLRGWFPDAGILVARPGRPDGISVALQGGTNGANHNHNDVGEFLVGLRDKIPLIDPGGEAYTKASFGPNRYDSEMLNSHGHAVPVVAGKLQRAGKIAAAKVLAAEFSPEQDRLVLDLSSAYDVKELRRLERAFTYSRAGQGALEVRDQFAFSQPQTFETALITYGKIELESADTLRVTDGDASVQIQISADGLPFEITQIPIKCAKTAPPIRIGIRLKDPVEKGVITCRITP